MIHDRSGEEELTTESQRTQRKTQSGKERNRQHSAAFFLLSSAVFSVFSVTLWLVLFGANAFLTNPRTQYLRHEHRTVGLLIIFENRQQGAGHGHGGAVERMHE